MPTSNRKLREDEALRERVLDTAEDIAVREGIERVTMRRLAAGIDYAPTVLYRLFGSKADLMDHLIARGYAGVRARYQEVTERPDAPPRDALAHLLQVYVEYALEHPNHYRMWFETGDLRLDGDLLTMSHGRLKYVVFGAWLHGIAACQADGAWPARTPFEVFQVLWSRVHGLISLRLQHPQLPWMALDDQLATLLD